MQSTCTSSAHAIARARAGLERTGPAPSAAIAAATAASFDLPLPGSRLIRCSSAWSSRPALTRAVRRGKLEAAAAVAVVVAVAGALTAAAAAPAFCSSRANDRASVTPGPVQNSSGASASRNRTVSSVVFLKTVSWTSAARADTTEESCHRWAPLVEVHAFGCQTTSADPMVRVPSLPTRLAEKVRGGGGGGGGGGEGGGCAGGGGGGADGEGGGGAGGAGPWSVSASSSSSLLSSG